MVKVTGIIPARYQSTRFPGKPLADICGKPMIQHVYERAKAASVLEDVLVATDDARIYEAVTGFGGKAVMTSPHHSTGTDRLAEVATELDSDIVVNIQGDEPLLRPESIEQAVRPLLEDESLEMSTLKLRIENPEDVLDPNVVKVVTDLNGNALYFSRAPIPYPREGTTTYYRHIGLYVYRREFLLRFAKLAPTPLETIEKLEQLRALENGYKIRVVETEYSAIGVDTPEDLEKVKQILVGEGVSL